MHTDCLPSAQADGGDDGRDGGGDGPRDLKPEDE